MDSNKVTKKNEEPFRLNYGLNRIYWIMLIPILFMGIGISSLIEEKNTVMSIIIIFFSVIILYGIFRLKKYFEGEKEKLNLFLNWLNEHQQNLKRGESILYQEKNITKDTLLVSYITCVSFIFPLPWGMKIDSAYYIKGEKTQIKTRLLYSLICVLFGWEGFWTVIWAIPCLIRNLIGGYQITVLHLLTSFSDNIPSSGPESDPKNKSKI